MWDIQETIHLLCFDVVDLNLLNGIIITPEFILFSNVSKCTE